MQFAEVTADIITLCQRHLLFSFFMRLQSDRYHYPKATGVLVGCKLVQCLVKNVKRYRGRELPTSEYIVGDVQTRASSVSCLTLLVPHMGAICSTW